MSFQEDNQRRPGLAARIAIAALNRYSRKGGGARFAVECNFTPSCSEYARIALRRFGVLRGAPLILGRLRRCNDPNCMHLISDPVPELTDIERRRVFRNSDDTRSPER